MLNRRYALLGWAVWKIGKIAAKRRARAMVPGRPRSMVPAAVGDRRPSGRDVVLPVLALGGGAAAVWFLFFRRRGAEDVTEAERELVG
jgi:hypothetical protein